MAQVLLQNNGDGVARFAQGSWSGTYTAADQTITLGFVPTYFKIVSATTRIMGEVWAGLAASNYVKTAAAGTRTLETDGKVVINTDGTVTLIASSGIYATNDTVVWEARA